MELMITVLLHRRDDGEWTKEELFPIRDLKIMDVTPTGSVLGAILTLSNDEKHEVDFKDIDGHRSC